MKTLILKPGLRVLDFSWFTNGELKPQASGRIRGYRGQAQDAASMRQALAKVARRLGPSAPDLLAFHSAFGGEEFAGTALVNADVLRRIESLVPQAPLHVPPLLEMLRNVGEVFPQPNVVVFETAFFARLPARERVYGLDPGSAGSLRRYGFHGIFHEAACRHAVSLNRKGGLAAMPRTLSICLEPRPEIAAAVGTQPVMVTSGATPLEGLPGETTCGEIDPGIAIALGRRLGWGPEQINAVLTRRSGLRGLAGKPATLETIFRHPGDGFQLAREVFQYRVLLACGAGIAALGGLDAILFSGRFAHLGETLGPWLVSRLFPAGQPNPPSLTWGCLSEPLDRLIADSAVAALLAGGV